MSAEQFAMWLRGFLTATTGSTLTSEQSEAIRKELAKVKVAGSEWGPSDLESIYKTMRKWDEAMPMQPFQPYWPTDRTWLSTYDRAEQITTGATFGPKPKVKI